MKLLLRKVSFFVFFFSAILLIISLLYLNVEKFPQLNRYYRYYHLSLLAKRFPPTSENYKRLKAMAAAAKEGKTTYSYETNKFPGPPINQPQNQSTNITQPNETK